MSNRTLLERQKSILAYLCSPEAFLGEDQSRADPDVAELDVARLRLFGLMTLSKRWEKIEACLPRTFELMGDPLRDRMQDFAQHFPPYSASRVDNARQFAEYLRRTWAESKPPVPYAPDLVAFELAVSELRSKNELDGTDTVPRDRTAGTAVRRAPNVALLRCGFDIRPLFDDTKSPGAPEPREVCLLLQLPPSATAPRVFEIAPLLFSLIGRLEDWRPLTSIDEGMESVVEDLVRRGFLERRG